jgi:hypothetical protein
MRVGYAGGGGVSYELPLIGRRREDCEWGAGFPDDLPDDLQLGDYWKYANRQSVEPTNLEGTVWGVYIPGGPVSCLTKHTVREHDDGTISVRPGDGCSNSIPGHSFHGYIDHGVWGAA